METKELIAIAYIFLSLGVVQVGWFGKNPKAMVLPVIIGGTMVSPTSPYPLTPSKYRELDQTACKLC